MMKRLRQLYFEWDERFFHWSKAQSPAEIGELFRILKVSIAVFTVIGTCAVYYHVQVNHENELEAMKSSEHQLVETRRREKMHQATANERSREALRLVERIRSTSFHQD